LGTTCRFTTLLRYSKIGGHKRDSASGCHPRGHAGSPDLARRLIDKKVRQLATKREDFLLEELHLGRIRYVSALSAYEQIIRAPDLLRTSEDSKFAIDAALRKVRAAGEVYDMALAALMEFLHDQTRIAGTNLSPILAARIERLRQSKDKGLITASEFIENLNQIRREIGLTPIPRKKSRIAASALDLLAFAYFNRPDPQALALASLYTPMLCRYFILIHLQSARLRR
jgi:hypothetical protein